MTSLRCSDEKHICCRVRNVVQTLSKWKFDSSHIPSPGLSCGPCSKVIILLSQYINLSLSVSLFFKFDFVNDAWKYFLRSDFRLGYLNWNVNKLDIERQVKPGALGRGREAERKVIRGLHKVFTMTLKDKGGEEERTSRTTLETLSLFIPQDHDSLSCSLDA